MRILKLSNRDIFTVIDEIDFEWAVAFYWWGWSPKPGVVYARTTSFGVRESLHRLISYKLFPDHESPEVDHKNGNSLDNRRDNLRLATRGQNNANRRGWSPRFGGLRGLSLHRSGKFRAQIRVNGQQKHLGHYSSPEEAARAYDKAATEHFGEFAVLNFPTI